MGALAIWTLVGAMIFLPIVGIVGMAVWVRRNPENGTIAVSPTPLRVPPGEKARLAVGFLFGLGLRFAIALGVIAVVAWMRGLSVDEFVDSGDAAYNVVRVACGIWLLGYVSRANQAQINRRRR